MLEPFNDWSATSPLLHFPASAAAAAATASIPFVVNCVSVVSAGVVPYCDAWPVMPKDDARALFSSVFGAAMLKHGRSRGRSAAFVFCALCDDIPSCRLRFASQVIGKSSEQWVGESTVTVRRSLRQMWASHAAADVIDAKRRQVQRRLRQQQRRRRRRRRWLWRMRNECYSPAVLQRSRNAFRHEFYPVWNSIIFMYETEHWASHCCAQ